MKNRFMQMIAFLLLAAGLALPAAASAESESERETFLQNFEAEYSTDIIDSINPNNKPVRILKTTKNGISVLLDKVLVTEDELAVSFFISGDFPQELYNVQLIAMIDIGPLLPYPPDSFEVMSGGSGGGGPKLYLLNEGKDEPLVALDAAAIPLMRHDGYISPSDPIQVRVRVLQIEIGWLYNDENGIEQLQTYYEDEVLEFKFETDGAKLAAHTKTFQLDHSFEINGKTYEFHRLRFNPMQLILFTGKMREDFDRDVAYSEGVRYVEALTDEGIPINLTAIDYPYRGFKTKILEPEVIQSLEQTQTLTLTPCYLPLPTDNSYAIPERGDPAYDCNPERAVTINIRE